MTGHDVVQYCAGPRKGLYVRWNSPRAVFECILSIMLLHSDKKDESNKTFTQYDDATTSTHCIRSLHPPTLSKKIRRNKRLSVLHRRCKVINDPSKIFIRTAGLTCQNSGSIRSHRGSLNPVARRGSILNHTWREALTTSITRTGRPPKNHRTNQENKQKTMPHEAAWSFMQYHESAS